MSLTQLVIAAVAGGVLFVIFAFSATRRECGGNCGACTGHCAAHGDDDHEHP